jgi:hypothetical protein
MGGVSGRATDRKMALAREWDELVDRARALPGLNGFLRVPSFPELARAADAGPVVVVTAGPTRCDAICVHNGVADVVALPALKHDDVEDRTRELLTHLAGYRDALQALGAAAGQAGADPESFPAFEAYVLASGRAKDASERAERVLGDLLEWLWDVLASPILDRVGMTSAPEADDVWPRLWWCPVGRLASLPLHAAGYHRDNGPAVLDRVVSSYTPSLRALAEAGKRPLTAGRMVVITVAEAPGTAPLPNVAREAAAIRGLLGDDGCTVLRGPAATAGPVLAALHSSAYSHFSCHGMENQRDPSESGLQLWDGLLRVADVAAASFTGEFAFLSACETATSALALPDEALNLAGALHYTGYRRVVATLWPVYDDVAAEITEAFYARAVADGAFLPQRSARALHDAVRTARMLNRHRPIAWAPYIHVGP